jgi:hypothetical protein
MGKQERKNATHVKREVGEELRKAVKGGYGKIMRK